MTPTSAVEVPADISLPQMEQDASPSTTGRPSPPDYGHMLAGTIGLHEPINIRRLEQRTGG